MKLFLTLSFAFIFTFHLVSQDTIYLMKDGAISYKQAVSNIDSVIFYKPTTAEETSGTFTDSRDGTVYKWVKIGDQVWMAENLKATVYSDGTPIPHVTVDSNWAALPDNNTDTARAYCWYNDSIEYKEQYGALYTYAAATNGDNSGKNVQGVCPTGWHLPSDEEWTTLTDELAGLSVAGGKLKATYGWDDGNGNGTDDYGFAALPGGNRFHYNGSFYSAGYNGYWWSSTEPNASNAWYRYMTYGTAEVRQNYNAKSHGFSVRCVRD